MQQRGEVNVGQLIRERHGGDAFLVGFTTYSGTVTAASDWDEPAERMRVRPALDRKLPASSSMNWICRHFSCRCHSLQRQEKRYRAICLSARLGWFIDRGLSG